MNNHGSIDEKRNQHLEELEKARARLGFLIQKFEKNYGLNAYLNRAPRVDYEQLRNAKLLCDRWQLLERLPRRGKVAEIGVDKGTFSEDILKVTSPSELHLVDIDLSRVPAARIERLKSLNCVTLKERISWEQLNEFTNDYFDWIYIDADHSYASVQKDIEAASLKVKIDGFLVFNDYTLWSCANMMNYGVSRAVNEFLNRNKSWRVEYYALQGAGYHDIALRRTL